MSLKEAATAVDSTPKYPQCGIYLLKQELEDDDLGWLEEKLTDRSVSHAYIGEVLRSDKHQIQDSTIGRHRNRKCNCGTV